MREICLDTETTGMAAKEGDRIIEIGCVELGEHGLTDKNFHEYIDPERQMEAEVIRVHKITNEFLVGKPKFADIADKFIEFVQGARLIIHNAQFDIGFLNEELRKLGKPSMEEICGKDNIIDSMELAKAAFPQMHNSLDALCKRLEIDTTRRVKEGHGALLDAELLGQVYLVLKQQQGILEIDAAPVSADVHDISDVELPVIRATEEDLSENERVLEMVRKAAQGPALYDLDEETFNAKRKEEQDALDAKEAKLQDLLKNL